MAADKEKAIAPMSDSYISLIQRDVEVEKRMNEP
jgi:hypothetical protein